MIRSSSLLNLFCDICRCINYKCRIHYAEHGTNARAGVDHRPDTNRSTTASKGNRMRMPYTTSLVAVVSVILASAAFGQSEPSSPQERAQQAVKTRQAVFDLVLFTWRPAAASLHPGSQPLNPTAAVKLAERLQVLATYIPEVFAAADTHAVAGLKTRARDGIWTGKSDFDQKAADLATASAALEAAAKGGSSDEIRKAEFGVAKACSGCHDQYRDN
jgi:cytochrome c556